MESNTSTTNNSLADNFCSGCHFIFKNITLINTQNEITDTVKAYLESSKVDLNEETRCKFCAGILNQKNFEKIFNQIKEQIVKYDHTDYKITTNFSPMYSLIHAYWKQNFKKNKYIENTSEIESIDISLIRKIFKPFFIPYLENNFAKEKMEEKFNMKSDFEIKIIFEFTEKFYDKVFEIFSLIPIVKKLGHKKFKPDYGMDKGAINELVRNCSTDLLIGLFEKYNLLEEIKEENLVMKVEVVNGSVFLQGTYLKFSREIGQSPWEVNGVKICNSSVQDEMRTTLKEIFQSDDCVLSAGGREDRDVRMLGSGRPFIMDIVNPKNKNKPLENIKLIEDEVNKNTTLIMIKNLTVCDKNYYTVLKKYEDSKMKFYTCLVWTGRNINEQDIEKINSVKDLNVIQKTPIRVMHRRTLMDRKKTIFSLDAKQINENFLIVNVLASAGTYIKEFIHSDLGRTVPSLMTILDCECDILQLDVLDIFFEQ